MLNIVLIGLAKELPKQDDKYELHRLLGALLSQKLTPNEKLNIIENEYNIPLEENIRRDVSVMCNLSQVEVITDVVLNIYENKFSLEQIALATKKSIAEVEAIIKKKESVLA